MIRLSPKETSILARIAQYKRIPKRERRALLKGVSPDAERVGRILLGEEPENFSEDIQDAANAYIKWASLNLKVKSTSTAEDETLSGVLLALGIVYSFSADTIAEEIVRACGDTKLLRVATQIEDPCLPKLRKTIKTLNRK